MLGTVSRTMEIPNWAQDHDAIQGTTLTPIDLADEMTLLHKPSSDSPDSRVSDCLIFAIS